MILKAQYMLKETYFLRNMSGPDEVPVHSAASHRFSYSAHNNDNNNTKNLSMVQSHDTSQGKHTGGGSGLEPTLGFVGPPPSTLLLVFAERVN